MTQRPPYLFASSSHIGLKEKRNRLQNRKIENKTFESYSIFWRFLGNWRDTIIYPRISIPISSYSVCPI